MTDHTGADWGADDAKDRRAPNEPLSTDEVDSVSGGGSSARTCTHVPSIRARSARTSSRTGPPATSRRRPPPRQRAPDVWSGARVFCGPADSAYCAVEAQMAQTESVMLAEECSLAAVNFHAPTFTSSGCDLSMRPVPPLVKKPPLKAISPASQARV